ncbi:MAG: hypothetical protein K0S98_841 [Propionibacteriaceae bacterium]|nr:hypothetical protein [Propionibacteriaceae bacterium]
MSDRIREVAERANVPETFVRQLVAAGALPSEEGELELAGAVRRVRLLRSWTAAGLSFRLRRSSRWSIGVPCRWHSWMHW